MLFDRRFSLICVTCSSIIMGMNKLNKAKRTQIIAALVEGNSLRATARMCDVAGRRNRGASGFKMSHYRPGSSFLGKALPHLL